VAATHLTEILKTHAADLLGRMEAQDLVEAFGQTHPKLVEELIPNLMPLGEVIKVLKSLLVERVSIRDMRTIFEALADHAGSVKDPDTLTDLVRIKLARQLTARYLDEQGNLAAFILGPDVEMALRGGNAGMHRGGPQAGAVQGASQAGLARPGMDPTLVPKVVAGMEKALGAAGGLATEPLLLTAPDLRRVVSQLVQRHAPGLAVMSIGEVDPKVSVKTLGVVKLAA
jgi:flagellar biosynthesis protein FlhA